MKEIKMGKKYIKCGLDFIYDSKWNRIKTTIDGANKIASNMFPCGLKKFNFKVHIIDCGEYYRINYGR